MTDDRKDVQKPEKQSQPDQLVTDLKVEKIETSEEEKVKGGRIANKFY